MGAAIAAGSQAEKGIWALFVIAAVTIIKLIMLVSLLVVHILSFLVAITVIIARSPIRFEYAVTILDSSLVLF